MTLCLALFLMASGDLPVSLSDPEPELEREPEPMTPPPGGDRILFRLRGGVWDSKAFNFTAVTTSNTEMRSTQQLLESVGIDAGGSLFNERFMIFASVEESLASKITLEDAGVCVGLRDWAGPNATAAVPHEALAYVGPMLGRFTTSASGFSKFNTGFGVRAGISLTWLLGKHFGVSFVGEYRYLKFDVKDTSEIVSGNKSIGGSGFWLGAGLDLRF
jgi:hypothetical protein